MADRAIDLLVDEWAQLDALCDPLTDAEWKTTVPLPGWTVQDCISHIIGIELMLMGEPAPEVDVSHLAHINDPVNALLETYVEARRALAGAAVLAEFREVTARRRAELEQLGEEDLDRVGPSPVGEVPYREFMRIRLFDCWMHEQDIRLGLDRPGHTSGPIVEANLLRFVPALGFVVGKKAGAPDGSSVVFDFGGDPVAGFGVVVDGRARVVDELPTDPTVTIVVPFTTFVALCGGRWSPAEARAAGGLVVDGDAELGERILDSLAFTP